MLFKEFHLTDNNHFVAMEYYNLILNRTFLILNTKNKLIGLLGNGAISTEGGKDILTKNISKLFAVRGDLSNPYSYLKNKYLEKIENMELDNDNIIVEDKKNFIIYKNDIQNVIYNPKKKFGMGYYPHNGRVIIEMNNNKKREFIILGNQSGQKISEMLLL